MPAVVEAPPRSIDDYETWFDKQEQRFYRQELRDLTFVADIFHFFRDFRDGEAGISVTTRYGKDHKRHRILFQLYPQDTADAQITTPEITEEDKKLLELLSGTKGLQVTIDLKRVTTKKPFGFTLELSPAGEEGKSFVVHLVDPPIVGESFEAETLMSLYSPYKNHGKVMRRCGSLYAFAHENPQLVEFLRTTAFWIQKVISRRLV